MHFAFFSLRSLFDDDVDDDDVNSSSLLKYNNTDPIAAQFKRNIPRRRERERDGESPGRSSVI